MSHEAKKDYNSDSPGMYWVEPPSDFKGEYPYNNSTQTESGHLFELDDTPDHERIRLQHGKSKTFMEIQSDGKRINKVFGDNYEIVIKDNHVLIKGSCIVEIHGDSKLFIDGNVSQRIKGQVRQDVHGNMQIKSDERVEIYSDGATNIVSKEEVNIYASDGLNVHGDLFVTGNIDSSQTISAAKNVIAGMKLHSNLGLDTLGGINCGFATAGSNVPGYINAIAQVQAPLGSFVLMKAIWMTDSVNKSLHNIHFHMTPKGPTSPPLIPMI